MTVASTTCRADSTANGVTTAFTVPFYFLADADLAVYVTDTTGTSTLKTLTTDYTVSGAGTPAGGTVTFLTAPTSGYRVSILRGASLLQPMDLAENDPLPAETLEQSVDRLTMMLQQVQERLNHAIKIQPSESSTLADLAVLAASRASTVLGFDASGNPVCVAGTLSALAVSSYIATLIDDATAGAARTTLGSGAIGDAVFTAATAAAARSTLGVPVRAARVDVASAATLDVTGTSPDSDDIRVTGTTTITAVNLAAGRVVRAVFAGALTLTNGANLTTQTGANIVTQAGDSCLIRATASNTVEIVGYTRAFETASTGSTGKSMVRVNTSNGYGSTNTSIRRFTTTAESQGADITYADSAANGGSFTINAAGVYAISYTDQFNTNSNMGISKNSAQLTTGINAITAANRLAVISPSAADVLATVATTVYLASGDVIRAHAQGTASGATPALAQFTITRVA